jgi:hypothetical protein
LAKNIGLSNFRIVDIERILKIAKHKPVINQIEFHPYLQQPKLCAYLAENDILLSAYAPLVPLTTKTDGPLTPVVEKIAKNASKTPAQVRPKRIVLTVLGVVEMVFAKECHSSHYQREPSTPKGAAQFQYSSLEVVRRGDG